MNSERASGSWSPPARVPGRRRSRRSAFCAAIVGIVVGVSGCAQPEDPWTRAAASGEVTLDGEPLSEGTITFFPSGTTKGPAAGGDIIDGRYDISAAEGPVVGTNRVEIRSVQKTGRVVESPIAVETSGPPIEMVEELRQVIPAEYNRDSNLEFLIKADGDNVNDVAIVSDPATSPGGT